MATSNLMTTIEIQKTFEKLNLPNINIKPEQTQVFQHLLAGVDVVAVLPTGFGKSILFQALPFMFTQKFEKNIVIVVTPLNSIISDQLKTLKKFGIDAAVLQDFNYSKGSIPMLYEEVVHNNTKPNIISKHIEDGDISILLCHPEALLADYGRKLMMSEVYQKNVVGLVIDEVHCIQTWGTGFRVEFSNLASLRSYFPMTPMLALTATASPKSIKEIQVSLNMKKSKVIKVSPNRENLFLCTKIRTDNYDGINSYNKILIPIAHELKLLGQDYPQTIIYLKLQYCGHAYKLFKNIIGSIYSDEKRVTVSNCVIAQFHAPQTDQMKEEILVEFNKPDSNIRVIFASPALGMGVNMPHIKQIIHITPPSSLEEYTQAIGRAGRTGTQSKAILYYCNSDISNLQVKNGLLTDEMVEYCKTKSCLREQLLKHFGFPFYNQTLCCSNCSSNEELTLYRTSDLFKKSERYITAENLEKLIGSFNEYLAHKDQLQISPDEEYFNSFDIFLNEPDTIQSLSDKMMIIVENISKIMHADDLLHYGIINEKEGEILFSLIEELSQIK